MKTIILGVLTVLGVLGANIAAGWAAVSFILYIAKDYPFNYWSLYTLAAGIIVALVAYSIMVLDALNEEKDIFRAKG